MKLYKTVFYESYLLSYQLSVNDKSKTFIDNIIIKEEKLFTELLIFSSANF